MQFFPDILHNPYIINDDSEEMAWYKSLLGEDYSEEKLFELISG